MRRNIILHIFKASLSERVVDAIKQRVCAVTASFYCAGDRDAPFEQSEQIQGHWLKAHPLPLEDTPERIRLRTQAQAIADEIVLAELIYT